MYWVSICQGVKRRRKPCLQGLDIMMTLFNEEYILKTYVESREKEASEKTKIGTAQKLYKKGNTIEDIADILDASVKEVEQWLGLVRA